MREYGTDGRSLPSSQLSQSKFRMRFNEWELNILLVSLQMLIDERDEAGLNVFDLIALKRRLYDERFRYE